MGTDKDWNIKNEASAQLEGRQIELHRGRCVVVILYDISSVSDFELDSSADPVAAMEHYVYVELDKTTTTGILKAGAARRFLSICQR